MHGSNGISALAQVRGKPGRIAKRTGGSAQARRVARNNAYTIAVTTQPSGNRQPDAL
jgi:hypothetical protein